MKLTLNAAAIFSRRHGLGPDELTTGQRFADSVTAMVGSWAFIIVQSIVLFGWIAFNIDGLVHFDPYPFILLNLFLSFQAAYTAPFLLMSQSRQAEIDRKTIREDLATDEGTARIVREEILPLLHDIQDRLKMLETTRRKSPSGRTSRPS